MSAAALIVLGAAIVAMIVMVGLVHLKQMEYEFRRLRRSDNTSVKLSEHLELKLKEFDDYKRRVDTLMIKSGFKL